MRIGSASPGDLAVQEVSVWNEIEFQCIPAYISTHTVVHILNT